MGTQRHLPALAGSDPHTFAFAFVQQVTGLLPGRRYALRVVLRPQLLPGYRDMPPLPPSPAAVAETQPASPEAPPPARLVGRARNFLKVPPVESQNSDLWPEAEIALWQ